MWSSGDATGNIKLGRDCLACLAHLVRIWNPLIIHRRARRAQSCAKGLGEPAIIPVAAAIANAVSHAVGARVDSLPIGRQWIIDVAG